MRNSRCLMLVLVSLILSCASIGNSFQHSNNAVHPGVSFNKVPRDQRVFVGIPLIFQQRRDVARELGINPYNLMGNRNDYMYHDYHPLEGDGRRLELGSKPFHSIHRIMKRGIIWNKIKKIKNGIFSVKKKLWKIKEKATKIIKGPRSTIRSSYASTGGSWGHSARRPNSMASYHPADSPSRLQYGVSEPIGWSSAASSGGYRSARSNYY